MPALALVAMACTQTTFTQPLSSPSPSPTVQAQPILATPINDVCHSQGLIFCAINSQVTQDTIESTICKSGWTSTIRPPSNYTDPIKLAQMRQEDLPGTIHDYEEDHRMPLELGGASRDINNLSPELGASPNSKDSDENAFNKLVCSHKILLVVAQTNLIGKWLKPGLGYKE